MRKKKVELAITDTVGLNLMAEESVESVFAVLNEKFNDIRVTKISEEKDLKELYDRKPDLVFSGIKYLGFSNSGRKRDAKDKLWFPRLLKKKGINHTGSPTSALEYELNKALAKSVIRKNKLSTAKYFVAIPGKYKKKSDLPLEFPLFLKPAFEGGGKGIDSNSIVYKFKDFNYKLTSLYSRFKAPILVEEFLEGREFTVAVIREKKGKKLHAFPLEIIPQENSKGVRILSEKAKIDDLEQLIPVQNPKLVKKLSKLAKKSFRALGARDYGRIDIRLDQKGKPQFLEANLVPGLNPKLSYFTKAYKHFNGNDYGKMVDHIVSVAMARA